MAKVKIYVNKAFKLQHDGEHVDFAPGNHSVEKDVAEHWFVKAHTGDEPVGGTDNDAVADELLAELDAKAKALQALADQLAEREKAAEARDMDLNTRASALDAREAALAEREKAADQAKQLGKAQSK